MKSINLLFVCLGNICRSPSAEAVMKYLVEKEKLEDFIHVDSAGIIGYHEGEKADSRMSMHAQRRGYRLESLSRPIRYEDFVSFDLIIGMDDANIDALKEKAPNLTALSKIHKMTDFSTNNLHDYVPDPYYGGASGFELVLDLLEDSCAGLMQHVKMLIEE